MSGGQVNGAGASPISQQQLPDDKALGEADGSQVIRLKNGKFKVGDSQGSVFNRTVRKVLMPKTYQKEAKLATQKQQAAAFEAINKASGNKFVNVSLRDRLITVTEYRNLLNPPVAREPQVGEAVAAVLKRGDAKPGDVYEALKEDSKGLHKGNQYGAKELAGGNYFRDILPPKKTAIHVTGETQNTPGMKGKAALHANSVGTNYIATQGPKSSSASAEYKDYFYQMLASQDTSTVVNLTNQADVANSIAKNQLGEQIPGEKPKLAKQYWPDKGKTAQFGENKVKTTEWNKGKDFDVITVQIQRPDNSSKEVKIYHFKQWPDHGVPETAESIEAFHRFTEAVEQRGETGRTTVHCRAGVGRTGVFITLDQLKQEAREGTLTKANLLERAAEVVWTGRQDRGKAFVQKPVQFDFIISEMKAELDRLAEQGSTTTEVSDLGDVDDEDIFGTVSYGEMSKRFSPPPKYSVTSDSIISKLQNGSYDSKQQIIDDINSIGNPGDLEELSTVFQEYTRSSQAHKEYYQDLIGIIDLKIRTM